MNIERIIVAILIAGVATCAWSVRTLVQSKEAPPIYLKCDRVIGYEDGTKICVLQFENGTDPRTSPTTKNLEFTI